VTTILVIEDDAQSRALFRDILEVWHYLVLDAQDAEQGWEVMQRAVVDLVVMDIRLPGDSGEGLLLRMKQDDRLARLPVLAVTAFAMRGDRERLLSAGFDDYVPKPIDTRVFPGVVHALLRDGAP
jgi:two-component system cell cycle response regulator DivK